MKVTLESLLQSRDARSRHSQALARAHAGKTLVVMTVVMPGSEKRNARSLLVAETGMTALREAFRDAILLEETKDLETGFEAYLVIDKGHQETKMICAGIEDSHPLGRLMDLDVIKEDGTPVSRQESGMEGRKCIVCGRHDARYCMRAGTHTQEQLAAAIDHLFERYGKLR